MIHIEFHPLHEALHHRVQQPLLLQDIQGFICSNAVHQPGCRLLIRAQHRCVGRQDIHPGVGVAGVGVHNACRQLHQLPDMSHQQNSLRAEFHSRVDGFSQEITVFDGTLQHLRLIILQKIQAVITRHQHQIAPPSGQLHFDVHPDGLNQGLLAHGFHDAGGA